jgi:hypothetical protein
MGYQPDHSRSKRPLWEMLVMILFFLGVALMARTANFRNRHQILLSAFANVRFIADSPRKSLFRPRPERTPANTKSTKVLPKTKGGLYQEHHLRTGDPVRFPSRPFPSGCG